MTRRVAIVGLGPKGLFALERLMHHARRDDDVRVEVDAFERHPVPGAGPVYDPGQPEHLLMNFASAHIDLWPPGSRAVPAAEQRSFAAWSGLPPAGFAPRAEVGRYLADGARRLVAAAAGTVRVVPVEVGGVAPDGDGWSVDGGDGHYDDVLLATGHRGVPDPGRRLPAIPDGASVAVRGFALTALDVCLELTEGRGGRFAAVGDGTLRYLPSGREPAAIRPFSRTGRPLHAKPGPDRFDPATTEALDLLARDGGEALLLAPADVAAVLVPAVVRVAERALRIVGGDGAPGAVLDGLLAGPVVCVDPRDELRRSLLVASGVARPDAHWALGHAWRALYPAIVRRYDARTLDVGTRLAFRRLGAELERIAFGPPVVNAAKLLALLERGVVTPVAGRAEGDVVVDAVIPGPGAEPDDPGVVGGLLRAGLARRADGARGIEVDAHARVTGRDGTAVSGLAALGRPTEDWVVGNDTLSRTLHPAAARWAADVALRARAEVAA